MTTSARPRQYVSREEHEQLLTALAGQPGPPREGFFGPASISWHINRESAVFLGAGRAALLQIAHPWVAAALAQHSHLLHNPIGRFHSTFRVVYTMLFGTRAQALAAAQQLYRRHTSIQGTVPESAGASARSEHYQANEAAALLWVYATLVDSALLAYEFVLPPLSPPERERYYAESRSMAALFGIPAAVMPADWSAFTRYVARVFNSGELGVDSGGLALGRSVLSGVGTWLRPPLWYRALTSCWLPLPLQAAFELPFGAPEQHALARAARWLPLVYRRMPAFLRFVGPYHEARARLRGRGPGMLTRANNRFWMGQPRLLYSSGEDKAPV